MAGIALYRASDDGPVAHPTVGWGGSEGQPSCVYDPNASTVDCTLVVEGKASGDDQASATVTVTAYADENTSKAVGSATRRARVEGHERLRLVVTIPVERPPHIDVDGETACSLSVEY